MGSNQKARIIEISQDKKESYFLKNYIFENPPKMDSLRKCLHCGNTIRVGDYKVTIESDGEEYIMCPNYPECDGTIIDWMPVDQN